MSITAVPLPTLTELHDYVRQTLCAHDRLDPDTTPFFAANVVRHDRSCGVLFHIEGPRLLKNSALWSDEDNRILFYDSIGTRFLEVRLSDSPILAEPMRRAA